jgi:hypothetical protein
VPSPTGWRGDGATGRRPRKARSIGSIGGIGSIGSMALHCADEARLKSAVIRRLVDEMGGTMPGGPAEPPRLRAAFEFPKSLRRCPIPTTEIRSEFEFEFEVEFEFAVEFEFMKSPRECPYAQAWFRACWACWACWRDGVLACWQACWACPMGVLGNVLSASGGRAGACWAGWRASIGRAGVLGGVLIGRAGRAC